MGTETEIDRSTPGQWRTVNARRWVKADGAELTVSDAAEFAAWATHAELSWSPTGPVLHYPPSSAAEALAVALTYLDAMVEPDSTTTVTGDVPEVWSLWLKPGEDDTDRVY